MTPKPSATPKAADGVGSQSKNSPQRSSDQRPVSAAAVSAASKSSSPASKTPAKTAPKAGSPPAAGSEPIPLPPAQGNPSDVWQAYFETHQPRSAQIREAVLKLSEKKQYDQVIALIEAALVNGQSQPWMYEVLALTMELAGRPREEVERVLLSNVDFSAVNLQTVLYSAAMLTRFDRKPRALELYRQASQIDLTRPEPYILGLKLAESLHDADALAWAASGTLMYAWTRDHEKLHREAEAAAKTLEQELRIRGQNEAADQLISKIAAARQRDLTAELSWNGTGDLDLIVEEPHGTRCSFETPRSAGGGILAHDGYGPDQKNTYETYILPQGFAGEYRLKVRVVSGEIVGKRATLKIVRYVGSPQELKEQFIVPLDAKEKVVRITLQKGRLQEPAPVPKVEHEESRLAPGRKKNAIVQAGWQQQLQQAREQRVRQQILAQQSVASAGAAVQSGLSPAGAAYQPLVTVLSEGVTLSAQAIVSADRRYVRLSLAPAFTSLTDVMTFSFFSQGNNTGGGNNNPPRP